MVDMSANHQTGSLAKRQSPEWMGKLLALTFSCVTAAIPVGIAFLSPHRAGGMFVVGYLVGSLTGPFMAIGIMRAGSVLFHNTRFDSLLGILIYLMLFAAISIAVAVGSFLS